MTKESYKTFKSEIIPKHFNSWFPTTLGLVII